MQGNVFPSLREMFLDDLRGFLGAAQIKPCRKTSVPLGVCSPSLSPGPFIKLKVCTETPSLNVREE